MAKVKETKIESFRPQGRNANKHSQRGLGSLESSMRKHGYVAPMTAAADGEIIDGSARLETVANVFDDDVLVVEHDGTKPIVMVRTDIPSADSPEARAISIEANRIAQLDLVWDAEVLLEDLQSQVDFTGLFDHKELDAMFATLAPKTKGEKVDVDYDEMWQGMPEFEHDDKTSFKRLIVHFKSQKEVDDFAALVGQKITDKTRFIWYPEIEIETYADKRYADES